MCHGSSLKYRVCHFFCFRTFCGCGCYNIHSLWCSQLFTTPTQQEARNKLTEHQLRVQHYFFSCLSFRCTRGITSMPKTYNLPWATQCTPDMVCLVNLKERSFMNVSAKCWTAGDTWKQLLNKSGLCTEFLLLLTRTDSLQVCKNSPLGKQPLSIHSKKLCLATYSYFQGYLMFSLIKIGCQFIVYLYRNTHTHKSQSHLYKLLEFTRIKKKHSAYRATDYFLSPVKYKHLLISIIRFLNTNFRENY